MTISPYVRIRRYLRISLPNLLASTVVVCSWASCTGRVASEVAPECKTVGDTQCRENVLRTCAKNNDGMLNWVSEYDCAEAGKVCDDASGAAQCSDVCSNECDAIGDKRCDGGGDAILECQLGSDGCNDLVVIEDCAVKNQECIALPALAAAFPEAEGCGAKSKGGRGGRVIEVTNLNSEGPGSLREAMEDASEPRIVVFRVGGIINLEKTVKYPDGFIHVTNPYLTVAGQTAPGGGILVRGGIYLNANDVVIRFISIRLGKAPGNDFLYKAGVDIEDGSNNLIVDHISVSWANDDTINLWPGINSPLHDLTFSWNLIAEGIRRDSPDPAVSTASQAMMFGGNNPNTTNVTVHHNAMMHFTNRLPYAQNKDIVVANNLMYHGLWLMTQLHGGVKADIIGNIYKRIPPEQGKTEVYTEDDRGVPERIPGNPSIFIKGNIGPSQPDPNGDNWAMVPDQSLVRRLSPLPLPTYPITMHSTDVLENVILEDVGNSRRLDENGNWVKRRDSVDTRLVNEYRDGTGICPFSEDEVGGFPVIADGTPYEDTDHDGMPEAWEQKYGLNPNSPADANQDVDSDGYTNIEEFLNGTDPLSAVVCRQLVNP